MAMSDELENSGKLVVRPEQVGSTEDSRGARVDSNKLDKAVSKKSDVQEEEVTTGGFRESNGDRESMRASDTTESGTARCENADPFESIEAHDHHQFEEKEFKAKITCGNRLIGYRKYKVLSFDTNSIKGNEVTSGGTEFIGLDGLDSAHKGYFPQNGNSTANLPTKDNIVSDQMGPPIAALQLSVKDESSRESESPVAVGDGSSSSQDGNASFNVCCGVWDWLRGVRG